MNLTSFGLLALMAALGGVIAYFADRWGRALGKKRLSFLGMRPRTTAEVFVVASGVLIPLVTIAIVVTASKDVRQWLSAGPELIRARDALEANVKSLTAEQLKKTEQLASVNAKNVESQQRLMKTQKELSSAADRLKAANLQLASLARQVVSLTANYRAIGAKLRTASISLTKAKSQVASLDRNYSLLKAQQQLVTTENLRLVQVNKDEASKGEELRKDGERLRMTIDGYLVDIRQKTAEITQKTEQLTDLNTKLETARQAVLTQSQWANFFLNEGRLARVRPMIYSLGEEVSRVLVEPSLSAAQARASLDSLLRRAQQSATQRGAKAPEADSPAAVIPDKPVGDHSISSEEQKDALIAQIANVNEPQLIVARSMVNCFAGEQVPVDVHAYHNPVVFKGGQTIAEERINARNSEAEIFQQIREFLNGKVTSAAIRADMVLVVSGREPAFEVTPTEVLNLVKAIKLNNRNIRLQAYADGDIRLGGPLKLQFRIQ